jgi:hypothetical protein
MPPALQRIRGLAWLLDNSIRIPGTQIRFGLDPILGLIPGLGDALGGLFSAYIVIEAARMGAVRGTVLRMVWNVLLETVIGMVPFLGDLFDAVFKANQRNIQLLERSVVTPGAARKKDQGFIVLLVLGFGVMVAGLLFGAVRLLQWILP